MGLAWSFRQCWGRSLIKGTRSSFFQMNGNTFTGKMNAFTGLFIYLFLFFYYRNCSKKILLYNKINQFISNIRSHSSKFHLKKKRMTFMHCSLNMKVNLPSWTVFFPNTSFITVSYFTRYLCLFFWIFSSTI